MIMITGLDVSEHVQLQNWFEVDESKHTLVTFGAFVLILIKSMSELTEVAVDLTKGISTDLLYDLLIQVFLIRVQNLDQTLLFFSSVR